MLKWLPCSVIVHWAVLPLSDSLHTRLTPVGHVASRGGPLRAPRDHTIGLGYLRAPMLWLACGGPRTLLLLLELEEGPEEDDEEAVCGVGCISNSTSSGRWSDGMCGCGQPSTLFSRNQSASSGPKSPSGRM